MSLPSISDFSIVEKIGSGSYATVYKAMKRVGCPEVVAIKCVDKSSLSLSAIDDLYTEIYLLYKLKHEHIVEMKDVFWDTRYIYIVMEYCNGGDLSSFIKKRQKLSEHVCREFMQQLALVLIYLRSNGVSHMDLKPQNLLLTKNPQLVLKVGDFGSAQYLSNSEQKFAIRGSPLYMAPEILLKRKYDARVDLWSFGVIMYECLFGKAPYFSTSVQELTEKIKNAWPIELPKSCHVSCECKDLLMSLLKHDPDERITFDDFFRHDFWDSEYAASKKNYKKAVNLIQQAVKMDTEKNLQSVHLYMEALKYFIPILKNETQLTRKETLEKQVDNYITRVEQLVKYLKEGNKDEAIPPMIQNGASLIERSSLLCPELRILSKSTPKMLDGLEIGEMAEQYFVEGSYALALERFISAFKILIPLMQTEPAGRRWNLLDIQMQHWITEAKKAKGLLQTKDIKKVSSSVVPFGSSDA